MKRIIILLILVLVLLTGCNQLIEAVETTVIMDGNKTITAHFKKIEYNLVTNVEPEGSGTITEGGIYDAGTIIEVEAIPAEGYEFDHWGNDTVFGKWTGLGITLEGVDDIDEFNADVDVLLANGFEYIRVHMSPYNESAWQVLGKAAVISAVGKGAKVTWGITGGGGPVTATEWITIRAAILVAAQWAQDNGVYEFSIGNEEEMYNDGTTLTDAQLVANLKSVATSAQSIFTNGNISYSFAGSATDLWIAGGKGDLDLIAANHYIGGDGTYDDYYEGYLTSLYAAFGDTVYLTEFGPSWTSLTDYSADEAVQAAGTTEMLDYIKDLGIPRAYFFSYRDETWMPDFGAIRTNDVYRLLWWSLLNSG